MNNKDILFNFILSLADNNLILAQRLSELCGHGPGLEQDIAITNISLDLIGQARLFFQYASSLDAKKRDEDQLAFLRNEIDFKNVLLVEQPNLDFGHVIVRQYLFDVFNYLNTQALTESKDPQLVAIAEKAIMEIRYHLRFSKNWLLRLGDGTTESRNRMQQAVNSLWPYCGEFFKQTKGEVVLSKASIVPDITTFESEWLEMVHETLKEATLVVPDSDWHHKGGKQGIHSEHMGHLLSQMQFMQRAYPNLSW